MRVSLYETIKIRLCLRQSEGCLNQHVFFHYIKLWSIVFETLNIDRAWFRFTLAFILRLDN